MRNRSKHSSDTSNESSDGVSNSGKTINSTKIKNVVTAKRSGYVVLALFILITQGIWAVYHYQFQNLPDPLTAKQVGKRGFSEEEAMKHVKELTQLGPHPVGSDALELGLQYVLEVAENIKKTAHWEVDVEVDLFHASSGANILVSGLFKGKTLVYSDLKHVVLKISPKYDSEATDSAILVSSHIDTVFAAEGAGDCSSCVAVMLELARGISHWAHGFKNSVIFLFNTGEEEGLNGAHSFITQHPWSSTIRMAVDLEAMGIGGASAIFQAGPDPWAIENFALVAKYPSAQILAQDLFTSGVIKSATDFQVYKEVAGLSGLDFAYADNTAVYHTKNDKLKLLKPGSLQHLGENMLAFLLHTAASSQLLKGKAMAINEKSDGDAAIYFDILGTYMVVFRQRFANMLYNSVILQSIMIWATSLMMGGSPAAISLSFSLLSIILMWAFSLTFSITIAFIVSLISSSPVPFISTPWLIGGLFAPPAFLGALTGQHIAYLILKKYISRALSRRMENLSPVVQSNWAKLEAERSLYKSGLLQWLIILVVGHYFKLGSSYVALVWLVSPAFAYGLLEATLSPSRAPKALKTITLLLGLSVPFLISGGMFIRLAGTIVGIAVRFDRNPGGSPDWLGSVIVAVYISAAICLTLVYLLSYIHISGAKKVIAISSFIVCTLSLTVVVSGIIPPFTEDVSRAVNVVNVVDASGRNGEHKEPDSYISFFSTTPGKLTKEIEHIGEGFVCGRENSTDFVTFTTSYSCWTTGDSVDKSDIPTLNVETDSNIDERLTQVTIDTKVSTRWSLAINTNRIEDFRLKDAENGEELVQIGTKSSSDGWHIIQFSGGKNAPKRFDLTLYWVKNNTQEINDDDHGLLLKLRTDVDRLTPKVKRVLDKLPSWCSLFGKSTSPHTLAFLSNLRVDF